MATMGAVAHANPQAIRDRINYHPATGRIRLREDEGTRRRHHRHRERPDATVTLRNPWAADDGPAVIHARLGDLIGTNPLGGLGLGPKGMIMVWGAGWPRSLVDDRRVVAVEYFEPLTPDYTESMLGYFVMQPQ